MRAKISAMISAMIPNTGTDAKKALAVNALTLLASDGGSRLLTFLANVHLAHLLGTGNYGITFLGLTILSYAMWGGDLGIATLGTREMAKPPSEREFTFGDLFSLKTLLGSCAMIAAEIIVLIVVRDTTTRLVSSLFLAALIPSFWQMEWYYQGIRNYRAIALIRYASAVSYLAGVWFLIDSPDDIVAVPLIYLGSLILASATALLMRNKGDRLLPFRSPFNPAQRKRWRSALKQSTPIGLGGIVSQTIQLLPPLLIAAMYTDSEVGQFGAAFRLAVNLMILDRAFIALYFPAVSRLLAQRPERSATVLRRTFLQVLSGGILLALGLTFFSEFLMELIYGPSFSAGAIPLALMGWFVAATLLNSFFSYALIAVGVEHVYFRSSLVSSSVGIILIVLLTWLYGVNGAAFGIASGEITMAVLMYVSFRKHLGVSMVRSREKNNQSDEG